MERHLSANADIVADKNFDNGIVKIQKGEEGTLNHREKAAVSRFELQGDEEEEEDTDVDEEDYLGDVLANSKKRKADNTIAKSKYRSTNHVAVTSNMCERLFSNAKNIMQDKRKSMSPYHLELLLILKSNVDLWDATTIQSCFCSDSPDPEDAQQAH